MIYTQYYSLPFLKLKITADESFILGITPVKMIGNNDSNSLTKKAVKQIDEYFFSKRKKFDLPLKLNGTDFQNEVWKELQTVKFGKYTTYSDIANEIGRPNAYRAVGNAVGKNPFLIVVPCHRILAQNGLGGFSAGIEVKKELLNHEGISY